MSLSGRTNGTVELRGKISTLIIDRTLTISGACADAKATGEAIERAITTEVVDVAVEATMKAVGEVAEQTARTAAIDAVEEEVTKAISSIGSMSTEEINTICK